MITLIIFNWIPVMGLGLLILLKKLTTKESPCLARDHPQPFGAGVICRLL